MSKRNSFAVNESIVIGRDYPYPYRSQKGMLPSQEWVYVFDDFNQTIATNVPTGWAAAIIDSGCTVTLSGANGRAVFTADAASEGAAIYRPASIQLGGRPFYMELKGQIAAAADDVLFGFGLTDLSATTNPEDLGTTASSDFIRFGLNDGAANPVLVYDKDNTGPVTQTATDVTISAATDYIWAIEYTGASTAGDARLHAYINGNRVLTSSTPAQIPEDLPLAPYIMMVSGNGAAHVASVDYIRWAYLR